MKVGLESQFSLGTASGIRTHILVPPIAHADGRWALCLYNTGTGGSCAMTEAPRCYITMRHFPAVSPGDLGLAPGARRRTAPWGCGGEGREGDCRHSSS